MDTLANMLTFGVWVFLAYLPLRLFVWGCTTLSDRLADRAVAKALSSEGPRPCLDPESRFSIHMTETEVSCHRPDGVVESVRWDDLQKVQVLTTSDGPLLPDRFWVLQGSEKAGCCIPWGATGDLELLQRLQELPGFDNQAIMQPAGITHEALHLCWEKSA